MNKFEIEEALKDYHWMMNTVKMMRESLEDAGNGLTAQYGIEAVMPKGKGGRSDVVYNEVIRRSKHWKQIEEYERKIKVIQECISVIQEEREMEILHWLLEGESMRWIGKHMELSHTNVQNIRKSIVKKMECKKRTLQAI